MFAIRLTPLIPRGSVLSCGGVDGGSATAKLAGGGARNCIAPVFWPQESFANPRDGTRLDEKSRLTRHVIVALLWCILRDACGGTLIFHAAD
jgi:hypothetical protein